MKKLIYLEEQTMANKFLKTATALTIMGTSLLGAGAFTAKAADNTDSLKFNDVPANHWSTKAIYDLANRKVVAGYGNNVFGFGDNVTRGQVARMIYAYVKPADADASFKNPFTDIKGHMFEKEIRALAKEGLVAGYGEGKFGPDDILTREQMAQVLTNAFKFKATTKTSFTDVDKNSWAYNAINALEENGVTAGTGSNKYSPQMHVTREQYSQFLYNSINVIEKETKPEEKPEVKPDPKPETKPEEKPEVKPDPKPETKPEEKPEVKPNPKPETKPEEKPEVKPDPKPDVQLPTGMDSNLVTENIEYYPEAVEKMPVVKQQVSNEAQRIIKEVNGRFGTILKYSEISNDVSLLDKNMYLPAGTIGAQFVVQSDNEGNYKIIFLDNNKATISLTKEWTKLLSGLNLDNELQEAIDTQKTKVFEKDNFKIRIAHSTAEHMMYVEVEKK
ncbi:S-layer homology domain-containing protein (plasmid) [Bacillus wiedmannii]|uniref:S-layer homology domain-containing protein n=1 Tax=Bacillus wiedmannii TaxID=1890302 RepID=UPI002882F2A1|nr:S-layer homology domain-containing protein [Bacillus wiedmannii]WMS85015.1 S-layer homology domain-containing protein [Bacillus wiedmannii]HDR7677270.1 S-layer homology domain-containing protein [Bacillus wiedmannii]